MIEALNMTHSEPWKKTPTLNRYEGKMILITVAFEFAYFLQLNIGLPMYVNGIIYSTVATRVLLKHIIATNQIKIFDTLRNSRMYAYIC